MHSSTAVVVVAVVFPLITAPTVKSKYEHQTVHKRQQQQLPILLLTNNNNITISQNDDSTAEGSYGREDLAGRNRVR
jgi:hypothetical protein